MLNSFYDKFIFTNSLQFKHYNFFLVNLPFVIMPTDALVAIAEKNDSKLNMEIYYAVKDSVENDIKARFRIDFGIEGDKGLEFMVDFFMASGWGEISRTDLDFEKAHALVTISNSPVAALAKGMKAPADVFIRGFLAGLFAVYFKRSVECIEAKCAALGDTNCEFIVKPIEEFNFANPMTRGQLRVE